MHVQMIQTKRLQTEGIHLLTVALIVFVFVQSLTSAAQESSPALVASASGIVGAAMATTTAGTGLTKPIAQVTNFCVAGGKTQ